MTKRKKKRKKASLKQTVKKLVAIVQEHLSKLPEEEQEARVAAFSRLVVTSFRELTPSLHGPMILRRAGYLPEHVNKGVVELLLVSIPHYLLKLPA